MHAMRAHELRAALFPQRGNDCGTKINAAGISRARARALIDRSSVELGISRCEPTLRRQQYRLRIAGLLPTAPEICFPVEIMRN